MTSLGQLGLTKSSCPAASMWLVCSPHNTVVTGQSAFLRGAWLPQHKDPEWSKRFSSRVVGKKGRIAARHPRPSLRILCPHFCLSVKLTQTQREGCWPHPCEKGSKKGWPLLFYHTGTLGLSISVLLGIGHVTCLRGRHSLISSQVPDSPHGSVGLCCHSRDFGV
jgi:hypothetical protein